MAEQTTTLKIVAQDNASASIARVSGSLSTLGQRASWVSSGVFGRLGRSAAGIGSGIFKSLSALATTTFVGGAIASMTQLGMAMKDAGQSITELTNRYGINAEALQVYGSMMKSSGGNMKNAASAISQLAVSMQGAETNAELAYVFQQVGLSVKQLKEMNPGEVLEQFSKAFSDPTNTNELAKQAILVRTMGQDGTYFLNSLRQGPEAYSEELKKMRSEGTLLSDVLRQ